MLSALTASASRLALVGLAKNTGKTVTLNALLGELAQARRTVGVTSIGRDGEEHDVIDFRIDKPRVRLTAGSLVATTDALLSASGVEHELLARTGDRTPLGEVVIARLTGTGAIEVAGPSTAAQVRQVADAMLDHGADQVLIDGAIDRRAASSPAVADGLVTATGAVLGEDMEEVVARTRDAVELARLARVSDDGVQAVAREHPGASLLVDGEGAVRRLPDRFVLTATPQQVQALLAEQPAPRWLVVGGALPEPFVRELTAAARRGRRELTVVVRDPTHVFLSERPVGFYRAQGVAIEALEPIELMALTVNPVAPRSHELDSGRLRALLAQAIPDVPIFDVCHPEYTGRGGSS